jgi:hypothetical protein
MREKDESMRFALIVVRSTVNIERQSIIVFLIVGLTMSGLFYLGYEQSVKANKIISNCYTHNGILQDIDNDGWLECLVKVDKNA